MTNKKENKKKLRETRINLYLHLILIFIETQIHIFFYGNSNRLICTLIIFLIKILKLIY